MKRRAFLSSGVATGLAVAAISGVAANGQNQRPPESRAKVIEEVSTTRAPKPVGPFSQAVKANGFVFVAGQVARDPKTDQVIDGDITAQTERIMENTVQVVRLHGGRIEIELVAVA